MNVHDTSMTRPGKMGGSPTDPRNPRRPRPGGAGRSDGYCSAWSRWTAAEQQVATLG